MDVYSIIDAVADKHEIWIGMRKKKGGKYDPPVVNPEKYDSSGNLRMLAFSEEDYFVVLSEDIIIS